MWIEYRCNNIGFGSCWLRAQSTQYTLPGDAHKLLGDINDAYVAGGAHTTPVRSSRCCYRISARR